jgi:heat shock protein HtpX
MKRVFLFLVINVLVIMMISVLMALFGVDPGTMSGLVIMCAMFGMGGAFISLQISRWTAKRAMGVQLIDPARPGSPAAAALVERVQGLSTRAGLPALPEIGVYQSPEVNAFATGPSKRKSLLAVSTGLLERMDDRAVEGVLGHEISHIVNGDMVTMTLIQGVVNTFVMVTARIVAMVIDNVLRGDDDGPGLGFFGYIMVLWIVEPILFLMAMPIIHAFSRHREYRADAGSAQLAGRETMIHALQSLQANLGPVDKRGEAIATLKISGEGSGLFAKLYASHPPIPDRIRALANV